MWGEVIAPAILNLDLVWKWMVTLTPQSQPLILRERTCIQAVLNFQTFDCCTSRTWIHDKFSPLICHLYAKFGLPYTSEKQTFRTVAQWCSKTVFCVYWVPESPIPVATWTKVCVCGRSLVEIVVSNLNGRWMPVSCENCVLSGRGLCDGLITHPVGSYRGWCV